MTAGMVKRPPDGVVVVSSTLSGEERSELQAFLESQPEVQEVRRVWHNVRTRDSYEDRLTLGLVVAAHDLVVHLKEAGEIAGAVASVATLVNKWVDAMETREEKKEKREHENTESIRIFDAQGRTATVVRRQKN